MHSVCLVLGWAKDVDEKAIRHPPTGASFSSAGDSLSMPSVQLILRWDMRGWDFGSGNFKSPCFQTVLLLAEEIDLFLFYSNITYGNVYDCFS